MASFHYNILFLKGTQERMKRLGWVTKNGHAESERQAADAQALICMSDTKDEFWECQRRGGLLDYNGEKLELLLRMTVQGPWEGMRTFLAGWGLIRSQEEWEEDTGFSLHKKVIDCREILQVYHVRTPVLGIMGNSRELQIPELSSGISIRTTSPE